MKLLVILAMTLGAWSYAEDVGTQSLIDSSVTHAKLYSGVEKFQDTTLTNAQIVAMSQTPITIVTAPDAGYVNVLTGAALWVSAGTTAIALQGSLVELRYTNASGSKVTGDLPAAVSDTAANGLNWYYMPGVSVVPVSAAAIVIRHAASVGQTAIGSSGNSWKVRAYYRTLKTNILSQY